MGIVGTTVFAAPISVPGDLTFQDFTAKQALSFDSADNNVFAESNESFIADDDAYLFASVNASQLTDVETESIQGGWSIWGAIIGGALIGAGLWALGINVMVFV
jgi:hypothetical protein